MHRDRGRDFSRQDYGRDDRSRSRDQSYSERSQGGYGRRRDGGYSGGGGSGRGSRGGGSRGGRGGGGRGPWQSQSRPSSMLVRTNYFKIEVVKPTQMIHYKVSISKAKRAKDAENKCEKNADGSFKVVATRELATNGESSELTRRILQKLTESLRLDAKIELVTDGSGSAYSNASFFSGKEKDFVVLVKLDCDDDEHDADLSKNARFLVKLLIVGHVHLTSNPEVSNLEKTRQSIDIILRSGLLTAGMKTFGKSPRVFYFPEDKQAELIGSRLLRNMLSREKNFIPIVGLLEAVRLCENGNMFFNCESTIDFADRAFEPQQGNAPKNPIKLLQVDRNGKSGEICGIKVNNVHAPIQGPEIQRDIMAAIKMKIINVRYEIPLSKEFEERKKKIGKSDAEIRRLNIQSRKNKCMQKEKIMKGRNEHSVGIGSSIIWDASDPNQYSFPYTKYGEETSRQMTVPAYFMERYGLRLQYPHMPLVYLGNAEWFPIEFLFQGYAKMKGANSPNQVSAVLDYFDHSGGSESVENIKRLLREASSSLQKGGLNMKHVLDQYNLRVSDAPIEVTAKVLPQPTIKFSGQISNITNGSWNLRNVKFSKPAELSCFAIADISGNTRVAIEFMETFLRVANNHGINVAKCKVSDILSSVKSRGLSPSKIQETIEDAMKKARGYYLNDQNLERKFEEEKAWFKTRVKKSKIWSECVVLPIQNESKCAVILGGRFYCTHTFYFNGQELEGRMMVKVREMEDPVDPLDLRYNSLTRKNETFLNEAWKVVSFQATIFRTEHGMIVNSDQVTNANPKYIVDKTDVDCTPIVFVILPDDSTENYGLVKMFCHYFQGVQSQCIVASKFSSQRAKDQYCSNVAIKVNAKLSNHWNKAHAWTTSSQNRLYEVGIEWVQEIPTMVMGISISNSLGQEDATSVVCATTSLDQSCMRYAQEVHSCSKTETVDGAILVSLVESLLCHFFVHNGVVPERILVYRAGVSEGAFTRFRKDEVQSIREGYRKFFREGNKGVNPSCVNNCKSGCVFCCPPITFVACMTRNSVKIVPSDPNEGEGRIVNKKNVLSGTCVDSEIIDSVENAFLEQVDSNKVAGLYSEPGGGGYDFLLIAHGSGKGTSKPVQYRMILNENAVHVRGSGTQLTKDKLELATFAMSFQYSTATKAVRLVPVLYYSSRYAETFLKYRPYLHERNVIVTKGLDEYDVERDGSSRARLAFVRNDEEPNQMSLLAHIVLPRDPEGNFFDSSINAHLAA